MNKSFFVFTLLFSVPISLSAEIVINELHLDEIDKTLQGEFIELYNTGSENVDLSQWAFTEGISFTFPANTEAFR